jgi:hypothetical protein
MNVPLLNIKNKIMEQIIQNGIISDKYTDLGGTGLPLERRYAYAIFVKRSDYARNATSDAAHVPKTKIIRSG